MESHPLAIHGLTSRPDTARTQSILLLKPPFFTPWTPPLGIAILKAYLESHGHRVRCYDYNTDSLLWGTHHKYFVALQALEEVVSNDGYSKLWWILNAHMLAHLNRESSAACTKVVETIAPLYGVRHNRAAIGNLIEIVQRYFHRLEQLTAQLDLAGVTVVGTSTYTTSLASSLFILRMIKRRHPHITTVMGGGAFADDLALGSDNLATLVDEYDFVDHFIIGEGELLFQQLLSGELAHKRVISLADISGKTLPMKEVPPPDFSDLTAEHYYHLTIEGARSCPFQCSFCSETIQWGEYRKKPFELFADQVTQLAATYRNNSFFLGDSLMNPYIFQFSKALLARNADILYDGYLRADKPVANREAVRSWARSGLYRTRLGIESAATRVLQLMDKLTTPATISNALRSLATAGIRTTTYWIVGFAGETEQDFQETMDFIREHHRFIYEFEAHPYYYYPYGQIGSRFHQCYSLYPDEVTEITRFKVWDIVNASPTREERYDRLARISHLASEYRLPNIYTMAERYQAEDRWHRLYPLAREIYAGTRKAMMPFAAPAAEFISVSDADTVARAASPAGPETVAAYRVDIRGLVEPKCLADAIRFVAERVDLLHMGAEEGRYRIVPNAPALWAEVTVPTISLIEVDADRGDDLIRDAALAASATLRPSPGACVSLLVVQTAPKQVSIVGLFHRGLGDARTLPLLLQHVQRAYVALRFGFEPTVLATSRPFAEAAMQTPPRPHAAASIDTRPAPCVRPRRRQHTELDARALETALIGMDGGDTTVLASELVAAALVTVMSETDDTRVVDIRIDQRTTDATLHGTAGPLSVTCAAPRGDAAEDVVNFAVSLRAHVRACAGQELAGDVLLDLEYCGEPPWLGGDEWQPNGFLWTRDEAWRRHDVVIAPHLRRGRLIVTIDFKDSSANQALALAIDKMFADVLARVLTSYRDRIAEERFWMHELKEWPAVLLENGPIPSTSQPWASVATDLDAADVQALGARQECSEEAVLLALFALVLSRVTGRESFGVLGASTDAVATAIIPFKVNPSWNLSFAQHLRALAKKYHTALRFRRTVARRFAFGTSSLDFGPARPEQLTVDIGFVTSRRGQISADGVLAAAEDWRANLDLVLVTHASSDRWRAEVIYRASRVNHRLAEKVASLMATSLDVALRDADERLGEFALEERVVGDVAVADQLANDAFQF